MTRPRTKKNRAKRVIKEVSQGNYVNPTSMHGTTVHEPGEAGVFPVCETQMRGIVYTNDPPNCVLCRDTVE